MEVAPISSNHSDGPIDRRILRTQQLIKEALLSLIMNKPFADIIVKDITEKANVNRSTFYAHYQDKYDLMDQIVDNKLSMLHRLSTNDSDFYKSYQPDFEIPDPYFVALFEHLTSNETFYRIILTRSHDPSYSAKMLEAIRDSFYIRISNAALDQKLLVPMDIVLDYISSAVMGIIKQWLEQHMIYSPHYMALQLTRLSMLGTYKTMGYMEY